MNPPPSWSPCPSQWKPRRIPSGTIFAFCSPQSLATVGFEDYAQLGEQIGDRSSEHTYRLIANATTDLLPSGYIRFIAV
ncbi:MAG TPA: hypothetical protein VGP06_01970, partial [Janthinobacterium sp.]|nr:hypothetical protein [Janthinobacterium sp.]